MVRICMNIDWIAQSFNRSLYSMIDTTKKYHIPEAYVNNI
jgi:hypothetical protein